MRNFFLFSLCIAEVLLLFWGVWLCLRVRNAPSAYNESKYFAWCIYNTVFIMILVGLLRLVILYTYYIHHCTEASPSLLFKVVSKYSYINRKAILSYIYTQMALIFHLVSFQNCFGQLSQPRRVVRCGLSLHSCRGDNHAPFVVCIKGRSSDDPFKRCPSWGQPPPGLLGTALCLASLVARRFLAW